MYSGGRAEPSPKKKSSMCLATRSCASFCQGIRRYSLRIIFIRSSHNFHASFDTLSKMRWPSSPGHGIESRPGSSFWNFTHITVRPLLLVEGTDAGELDGPQASAMQKIVVYFVRQPRVRLPQRALHVSGGRRAREDESQIARAFGQRHQQLIRLRRDVDRLDPLDAPR